MRFIADIGGTNARLAMSENGVIRPQSVRNYANDDWPHFNDMLTAYLADQSIIALTDMVIALAGPVTGERAELTNRNWMLDTSDLKRVAKCDKVTLLNDLTALGYSVSVLRPDQLKQLHSGNIQGSEVGQSLVVGIGTGFNVSPVIQTANTVTCLSVEAGHVSMPLSIVVMLEDCLKQGPSFATVEDLFSGRGFTQFCQVFCNDSKLQGASAVAVYGKSKL